MLGLKGQEDSEEELGCESEPDRLCFCIRFGKLFSPELRSQGDSGVCGVWGACHKQLPEETDVLEVVLSLNGRFRRKT
ncbi:Glycerol-3-phosphate acyltransferase [Dissostichus eleginoides]|uniref:Glycerol-3-phosphate acyltransferase n=1 Tax=Dissostichus eleginoides TaxID=100907 RepID=A0AAD9FJS2_DISEL|nr:Glycerol-3-phosphate acyltransferase [Dissostichus eleginoides]